jgi:hypothetical protein
MSPLTEIRTKAGWSRDRAAVEARVAYATARLYEANPEAVRDPNARARLDAAWRRMEAGEPVGSTRSGAA